MIVVRTERPHGPLAGVDGAGAAVDQGAPLVLQVQGPGEAAAQAGLAGPPGAPAGAVDGQAELVRGGHELGVQHLGVDVRALHQQQAGLHRRQARVGQRVGEQGEGGVVERGRVRRGLRRPRRRRRRRRGVGLEPGRREREHGGQQGGVDGGALAGLVVGEEALLDDGEARLHELEVEAQQARAVGADERLDVGERGGAGGAGALHRGPVDEEGVAVAAVLVRLVQVGRGGGAAAAVAGEAEEQRLQLGGGADVRAVELRGAVARGRGCDRRATVMPRTHGRPVRSDAGGGRSIRGRRCGGSGSVSFGDSQTAGAPVFLPSFRPVGIARLVVGAPLPRLRVLDVRALLAVRAARGARLPALGGDALALPLAARVAGPLALPARDPRALGRRAHVPSGCRGRVGRGARRRQLHGLGEGRDYGVRGEDHGHGVRGAYISGRPWSCGVRPTLEIPPREAIGLTHQPAEEPQGARTDRDERRISGRGVRWGGKHLSPVSLRDPRARINTPELVELSVYGTGNFAQGLEARHCRRMRCQIEAAVMPWCRVQGLSVRVSRLGGVQESGLDGSSLWGKGH